MKIQYKEDRVMSNPNLNLDQRSKALTKLERLDRAIQN